jgi:hypothetical protein
MERATPAEIGPGSFAAPGVKRAAINQIDSFFLPEIRTILLDLLSDFVYNL